MLISTSPIYCENILPEEKTHKNEMIKQHKKNQQSTEEHLICINDKKRKDKIIEKKNILF